ncbi:DegT/DnrJ/EryC1/StrS family aminotransferase [Fulvivirga kasyanovii]|uniref:DegT/DnrJ/EryC1/StrS family aminotransferase n=1 Tax=Fulvivirga kasyanovii TaxID=396812 RepID=A0ABW9RI89_9BACT|nr:DegT/DnrJ/EryC1/StrS family aminotransferase [Fulvivirga kasyanovii]MTI23706.1 DegT/DnrJ/EryC1/StrS family aminotransferase [Fulvivirga kasyanovii]
MKVPFFDLKRQYDHLRNDVNAAVHEVLNGGSFIGGKEVEGFESSFAEYTQTSHCIACGNGTDALELALRALDIGPGDEVIIPAFTFVGDAEVISLVGATVVLVDILSTEYTLDPSKLEAAINDKTKAIICTHLYGLPCRMDQIMTIAKKHGIKVVEDCAQAHGASLAGKPVGSLGDIAAFSFYPTKNLGAYGDAGAIVTNNDRLAEKVRLLANHGQISKNEHIVVGRNSRMDVMQATVLNVKLKYLDEWNRRRRQTAQIYSQELQSKSIIKPQVYENAYHVYHLYVVRSNNRNALQGYLKTQGVVTEIHYPKAIHQLEAFRHLQVTDKQYPVAEEIAASVLSLPVFPELKEDEIRWVVRSLNYFTL